MSSSLSSAEKLSALAKLRNLRNAIRQIGSRASISLLDTSIHTARVEYAIDMDPQVALHIASMSFPQYFHTPLPTDVAPVKNIHLVWGLRMYSGDDMVDISYSGLSTRFLQNI